MQFWQTWIEALRERGYIQGQNLVVECRYTEGRDERAEAFAAELVSLKVDLIVASGTNQVRAAKQATSAIPIVMHSVMEPVRRGLVAGLARPGGNVTGLTESAGMEIYGKYLQLLKEAVPTVSRVAALRYSGASYDLDFGRETYKEMEAEARSARRAAAVLRRPAARGAGGRLFRDDQGEGRGTPRGAASLFRDSWSTDRRSRRTEPAARHVPRQNARPDRGAHGLCGGPP